MGRILRALALFAFLLLTAFTTGDLLTSEDGKTYQLIEVLGQGDFGSVWKVKDLRTGRHYTLKLYSDPHEAQDNLDHANLVAKATEKTPRPNLLRIFPPQLFTDAQGKRHRALRAELGGETVQALAPTQFRLERNLTQEERGRRIKEAHTLMNDLLAASDQLSRLHLVHHDLNPRNILQVKGKYKASDFDGVTVQGKNPPSRSWEVSFGAIEYERASKQGEFGAISDLQTIANTLFFALFGKSPIQAFSEQELPQEYQNSPIDTQWKIRSLLWKNQDYRNRFQAMINNKFQETFENVPSEASKEYQELAQYISSAAKIDPAQRQQAIQHFFPKLKASQGAIVRSQPGDSKQNVAISQEAPYPTPQKAKYSRPTTPTQTPSLGRVSNPKPEDKSPEDKLDQTTNLEELFQVAEKLSPHDLLAEGPRKKLLEKAIPWIREITTPELQREIAKRLLKLKVSSTANGSSLILLPLISEISHPDFKEKIVFVNNFLRLGRMENQDLSTRDSRERMLFKLIELAVTPQSSPLPPNWSREALSIFGDFDRTDHAKEIDVVAQLLATDWSEAELKRVLLEAKGQVSSKKEEIADFRRGRTYLNLGLGLASASFAYAAGTGYFDLHDFQGLGTFGSALFSLWPLKEGYGYLTNFSKAKFQDPHIATKTGWEILRSFWRNKKDREAIDILSQDVLGIDPSSLIPASTKSKSCKAMLQGLNPLSYIP